MDNEIYNGISGEVNVNKLTTYLYFIHEAITDLRISNFMEFPNDTVALKSFLKFLEDKKGEEHLFKLCKACEIDVIDRIHEINKCVCHGDEAEKFYQIELDKLIAEREE